MLKAETLYDVINVDSDSDEPAIGRALAGKRRFWRLRQNASDPRKRREAEEKIEILDTVEQTLLNPETRRAYDATLPRSRTHATFRPYVTLEHLWMGTPDTLHTIRTRLHLVQGSAVRRSTLAALLTERPDLSTDIGLDPADPAKPNDQLLQRAETLGLQWKRE